MLVDWKKEKHILFITTFKIPRVLSWFFSHSNLVLFSFVYLKGKDTKRQGQREHPSVGSVLKRQQYFGLDQAAGKSQEFFWVSHMRVRAQGLEPLQLHVSDAVAVR